MSQVASVPPPPISPIESGPSYFRYVLFALVALVGLVVILEMRLVNSPAGKEAAQRILGDASSGQPVSDGRDLGRGGHVRRG